MPAFFEGPRSSVGESDAAVVVDVLDRAPTKSGRRFTTTIASGDDAVRVNGTCALAAEQRVYTRIISGMHSSISLHIAHSHCPEMDADQSQSARRGDPMSLWLASAC
ncbi:hypothetical protein ACHAWF_001505 [Thalassiosira exigua]